jgi:L-fuculose-phosphate aldolase
MNAQQRARDEALRKLNLVQAALNADDRAPRATRLGDRVTVTDAAGKKTAALEVDGERVWLSALDGPAERRRVDDLTVAAIVALVERVTLKGSAEQTEAEARSEIARYAALLWERGLVFGSSGNVSVRLGDGSIVVTPTGRSLRALQPEDLVRTTAEGVPIGSGRPTSELKLHIAAYRVRPEIRCVIHTHPTYCVGWSKSGRLFPLDTVGAIESLGSIAFTRYAKSGTQELADTCSEAFAIPVDTIVMERHGLSSVATTLETAYLRTELAEQTATIEFAAQLLLRP